MEFPGDKGMTLNSDERAEGSAFHAIAERKLKATSDGKSSDVFVRFGRPEPYPKGDWACAYQIAGIGDEKVRWIVGIDAVQALQLAMFQADASLSLLRKAVTLTFLDENHLGFPSTTKEATGNCPYCRSGDAEC
jgi:hypothetical protein